MNFVCQEHLKVIYEGFTSRTQHKLREVSFVRWFDRRILGPPPQQAGSGNLVSKTNFCMTRETGMYIV